jgi:hypothetical protein
MKLVWLTLVVLFVAVEGFNAHGLGRKAQEVDDEEGRCGQPCEIGRQFCGSDAQCHTYTCNNWFRYSGWSLDVGNATLTCEKYNMGKEENLHGVIFGCGPVNGGFGTVSELPAGDYSKPFNRKCSATVETRHLDCYDFEPTTDFGAFLNGHDPGEPLTCESTSQAEQQYIYQVILKGIVEENGTFTQPTLATGPANTGVFHESDAFSTMYAITSIATIMPTGSPTAAPTVEVEVDTSSARKLSFSATVVTLLVVGSFIL